MAIDQTYLVAKILHVLFVVSWFACLFYLPRILVNLAEEKQSGGADASFSRLLGMARRLYRFGHIMMGLAILSGLCLWLGFKFSGMWLHIKLTLVLILVIYQMVCGVMIKRIAANKQAVISSIGLRYFNELPAILLLCILVLVFFKPGV